MTSRSQLTLVGWLGVCGRVRMTERDEQITRPFIARSAVLSNPYQEISLPSFTSSKGDQCNEWDGSAHKHYEVPTPALN
jgi:hypothetical protein